MSETNKDMWYRYTGYIHGLGETFGKTPVQAQLQTREPANTSFLFTRTVTGPVATPVRDPCNYPDTYKPAVEPANLWPSLQTTGKQASAKPPSSHLALGDGRINPFVTSYKTDFSAPFQEGERIRSPLRNKNLKHVSDLREIYSSAFQRVGEWAKSNPFYLLLSAIVILFLKSHPATWVLVSIQSRQDFSNAKLLM